MIRRGECEFLETNPTPFKQLNYYNYMLAWKDIIYELENNSYKISPARIKEIKEKRRI